MGMVGICCIEDWTGLEKEERGEEVHDDA